MGGGWGDGGRVIKAFSYHNLKKESTKKINLR